MPRLRLIAGPNGSGKTTLTQFLISKNIPLGQYLNPDDIAKHIDLSSVLERTATALSVEEALLVHFAEATPDGYLDIYESMFNQIDSDWFVESVLKKWDRSKVRFARLS